MGLFRNGANGHGGNILGGVLRVYTILTEEEACTSIVIARNGRPICSTNTQGEYTAIREHITPIRDKQFFFFLKKSFNKSLKRGLFFVYLLLIINHITK